MSLGLSEGLSEGLSRDPSKEKAPFPFGNDASWIGSALVLRVVTRSTIRDPVRYASWRRSMNPAVPSISAAMIT
jgi:hypothetical protein